MNRKRASFGGLLAIIWFAGLITLAQAKPAFATLDCEEYPELCPPPCPGDECRGVSECDRMAGIHCQSDPQGTQCTNTWC